MSTNDDPLHLRLLLEAPAEPDADIARALRDALAPFGDPEVRFLGPYWKIPTLLEYEATVITSGPVDAAIAELQQADPDGWTGDVWNWKDEGRSLLHPATRWVWLTCSD